MITKEMIKDGLEAGLVKLVDSPHNDGVVCQIGDNWFYFGGLTAEGCSVEEYVPGVPAEDIVDEIYGVLEDFRKQGDVFEDEYAYYEAYLQEQLKGLHFSSMADRAKDFIRENPALAREIFWAMDRESRKEDVVGKLADMDDLDVDNFSEEDIEKMTDKFMHALDHSDNFWDGYWACAESAIEEFVEEKVSAKLASKSVEELIEGVKTRAHEDAQASQKLSKDCVLDGP